MKALLEAGRKPAKPILLYFHFDHDDPKDEDAESKASEKECGVINEEQVARWMMLYRCFSVDADKSAPELLALVGAQKGRPSFAIVDPSLKILATSPALEKSRDVVAFLKGAVTSQKDYWKGVEKTIAEQTAAFEKARALEKAKKYEEALPIYDSIRRAAVRIGEDWDDAVDAYFRIEGRVKSNK